MPLFEFICNSCKEHFEALVFNGNQVKCPKCKSVDLVKQFSTFSSKSQSNNCSNNDFCQNMQSNKHKCCSGCSCR
ncbi:MAG: hypothetical protein LBG23_04305 [Endomicrobium sp.]|jgi:putative FmdB family regulatory protein|nr:hypothetical protein [Endomicrobium sp.]